MFPGWVCHARVDVQRWPDVTGIEIGPDVHAEVGRGPRQVSPQTEGPNVRERA